eukprot:5647361-Prymnesium_polylepis.1
MCARRITRPPRSTGDGFNCVDRSMCVRINVERQVSVSGRAFLGSGVFARCGGSAGLAAVEMPPFSAKNAAF